MIGIEITNVMGTFMLEKGSVLTTTEFRNEVNELENVITLEVTNVGLEIVYLPKDLLMMSVYKNITS